MYNRNGAACQAKNLDTLDADIAEARAFREQIVAFREMMEAEGIEELVRQE